MSGEPQLESAAAETKSTHTAPSISRNALLAFLAQITTGFFTTVLTLYLLRALGSDGYGVFALAVGIGAVTGVIGDGTSRSAARFLAESRNARVVVTDLLGDALRLQCLTGVLVATTLFAAAGAIAAAYDEPALAWPLRVVAVASFAQSVFLFYTNALGALAQIAATLRIIFFEGLAETVSSIALVMLGAGVVGAALGRAAGYLVGVLLAAVVVIRMFDRSAVRVIAPSERTQEIARYAVPLVVIGGAYTLYAQANTLVIGALLGTAAVGIFAAPMLLTVPLRYLGQSLAVSVAPRQVGKGSEPGSVEAFQASLRWIVVYQAALLAPLIVWADPIVGLVFGSEFSESADVLRVLSFYLFLAGLSPLISTTVDYLGHARQRIPIVVLALVINVSLDIALLPRVGVVGAAIATDVAYALYVPAHFRICRRELGLSMRPVAMTLARALTAAVSMGLVLYAVGTDSLSPEAWLLGGTLGVLVYCTALILTGEITRGEFRTGLGVVAAAIPRFTPRGPRVP